MLIIGMDLYIINLFDNRLFIDSLKYCKGLFVFSQDLKNSLDHTLRILNIHIVVTHLYFPVNEPKTTFDIKGAKEIRAILSMTTSLENHNTFSFYRNKFTLINSDFMCFYPKNTVLSKLILNPYEKDVPLHSVLNTMTKKLPPTNWNRQLFKHIHKLINNVYEKSCDETELDGLIANNIVFCYVNNGSTITILNECIVRNTPIIINRHPLVLDLLGPKYPLYYSDTETDVFIPLKKLKKAHKYLKKINKSKFRINTFIGTLNNIIC